MTTVRVQGETSSRNDPATVVAALAGCGIFLSLTAVSLVTLDRIKYAVKASEAPITFGFVWSLTRPWDFAIILLLIMSGMILAVAEWRDRAFRRLISGQSPVFLWLFAVSALVWFGHAILTPGLINLGDAGTHVARVNHLAMAISEGASLYWDNYFFGGSTLLQFTGPFFHWAAAIVQLAVGDPTQAVKYTTFGARMVAAAFMFGLARRLGLNRSTATIATMFYAGSYFVTYMEIIRASFPQIVNFAAMPAVLYFVEGILIARAAFGTASVGLALSAIAFVGCHPPTAALFAMFAAIYAVVRLTTMNWPRTAIQGLLIAGGAAGLGSVYFLVPFAVERSATADNFASSSLIALARPAMATFHDLIVWGRSGTGPEYSSYFGLPMLLCFAAGIWLYATRPPVRRDATASLFPLYLALAVLTLFVRGAYVRQVTFTFFFLCVASGIGLQMMSRTFSRATWLPALIFVLVAIDSGPAAVQPWIRTDLRFYERGGQELASAIPDQRIMEISFNDSKPVVSVDPASSVVAVARVQMLNGPHKQDATPAHNPFAAMLKLAEADLRAGHDLTPETQNLLAAVNVGWCFGAWDGAMGLPDWIKGTQFDPVFGRVVRIAGATPVLASGRLETMERPASFNVAPFWDFSFDHRDPDTIEAMHAVTDIQQRMDVDLTDRRADRFLVPLVPSGAEWSGGDGVAPRIEIVHYSVEPGSVHVVVEADGPGYVRLVHPLTPYTRVMRNGVLVSAIPDVESLAVLPIQRGTNDIVLAWVPSVLRQTCFWTSVGVSMVLLGSLIWLGWRSRLSRNE
jgi:hypothetical protein